MNEPQLIKQGELVAGNGNRLFFFTQHAIAAIADIAVNTDGITHIPVEGRFTHRIHFLHLVSVYVPHATHMALRLVVLIHHPLHKHCLFTEIRVHTQRVICRKNTKTPADWRALGAKCQ